MLFSPAPLHVEAGVVDQDQRRGECRDVGPALRICRLIVLRFSAPARCRRTRFAVVLGQVCLAARGHRVAAQKRSRRRSGSALRSPLSIRPCRSPEGSPAMSSISIALRLAVGFVVQRVIGVQN